MKKVLFLLVLVLASLTLAGGCGGADEVTGPGEGIAPVTPPPNNGGNHPRPTPDPCRQFPTECD